jgi:hypothetical protein
MPGNWVSDTVPAIAPDHAQSAWRLASSNSSLAAFRPVVGYSSGS